MEPGERRRRAEGLRGQVREHDLSRWLAGLLADLEPVAT
jgi:trehalose-6-phosphate synthase